jgi:carbohydrate-selective porin OprB
MVTKFFYLQPDVQFIFNPGGRKNIDDALVVGTRVGVIF